MNMVIRLKRLLRENRVVGILGLVSLPVVVLGFATPLERVVAMRAQDTVLSASRDGNPCQVSQKWILKSTAQVITAPRAFVMAGGEVLKQRLEQVAKLPNLQLVVIHGPMSGLQVLDCRGPGREVDLQIGYNSRDGSQLIAMSWQPFMVSGR